MLLDYLEELGGELTTAVSESAGALIRAKAEKEASRHTVKPEQTVQPEIPGQENKQLVKGVNSDGRTMIAGEVGNSEVTNPTPWYKTKPVMYGAGGVGVLLFGALAYRLATK